MDFSNTFGATFREVGKGERNGAPTHIVKATRTYSTVVDDLWGALTEKPRLARWFSEVSGDFRPNGRFSIKGNAEGDIIRCEPPKSLALSWEFAGNISWVSVSIESVVDGALLTLEHELPTDKESQEHWEKYGPGATGVGWEMAIFGLDAYLSNTDQMSVEAGMAWLESDTGKAKLREWAFAWGAAHEKAGQPVTTAKGMAERTAAFYTGET